MERQLDYKGNKAFRLLFMNECLDKGDYINKTKLALQFNVTKKTIQRDIDDLRAYLADNSFYEEQKMIKYDKQKNAYHLVRSDKTTFNNKEILVICKILLESRALCKRELNVLLFKLLNQTISPKRKQIEEIIRSELFYYVPLKHNKELLDRIWELSEHILKNNMLYVVYIRKDNVMKSYQIKPVSIMFSEYYFYLIAFMGDDSRDFPTIFRIDRLKEITDMGTKFVIPYREKFNEGEFRKRVQFMYSGELRKVKFEFSGPSLEAVLDRLPTAEVLSESEGKYIISVEVYGNGIDMWLRSQGNQVKILNQ